MIGTILRNLGRLLALMLVQVLVLDHVDLANGFVVPYLYVLFLLMLPFELPTAALLVLGGGTGALMDLLSNTPGMHTSACLVLAFGRPFVQRILAPRDGYEFGSSPSVQQLGLAWWVTYGGILVLLHHLWLFYFELFRFDRFFSTLLRALSSTVFTLLLCILVQYLFAARQRRRI